MRRLLLVSALAGVALLSCSSDEAVSRVPRAPRTQLTPTTTATTIAVAAPMPSPSTTVAQFRASVRPIDDAVAARMTASWKSECPVQLEDLRLITLTHWGFDGKPHDGELVIHAEHGDAIVSVFGALYRERFPIEQIRLVDEFGADDDRSMAANNTSAFNCRSAYGSQRWSEHAYGRAIDINPVQNPYVTPSGDVVPPAGAAYTDRSSGAKGMIVANGPVTEAFETIGWIWGGTWSSGKDYQHFSSSGR